MAEETGKAIEKGSQPQTGDSKVKPELSEEVLDKVSGGVGFSDISITKTADHSSPN